MKGHPYPWPPYKPPDMEAQLSETAETSDDEEGKEPRHPKSNIQDLYIRGLCVARILGPSATSATDVSTHHFSRFVFEAYDEGDTEVNRCLQGIWPTIQQLAQLGLYEAPRAPPQVGDPYYHQFVTYM